MQILDVDKRDRYDVCDECCVAKLPLTHTHSTLVPLYRLPLIYMMKCRERNSQPEGYQTSDRSFVVFLSRILALQSMVHPRI